MNASVTLRSFAILACCMIGTPFAAGQGVDLKKETRLQTPISVKLKIVPIPEALSRLSKLANVGLDFAANIKDLKISVFVANEPVGIVLDKIAETLGCEWKADGPIFRLSMSAREQSIRDRFITAEDKAAQKEISDDLEQLVAIHSMSPVTAAQELQAQLAAQSGQKGAGVKYDPDRVALLRRAQNRQDLMLGKFLATMPSNEVNQFWQGDVIAATPEMIAEDTNSVSTDIRRRYPPTPRNNRFRPGTTPDSLPLFVQYDPYLYRLAVLQGFGVRYVAKHPPAIVSNPIPIGELAKMDFGKEVLAWDEPVPSDGDLSQLSVGSSDKPSQYSSQQYSISDFLEKAFDQTKTPIVSDAFRVPAASRDINHGDGAFTAWLNELKKQNHLATRFEDGVVMVRHGGFWRLRKFETPEDEVQALEAKSVKGSPTLDDYAAFISKLTPEQAKEFSMRSGVLAKFDTKPIELGLPALKFYYSLDKSAVERSAAGGIAYVQLNGGQRQAFVDAAIEGVFCDATPGTYDDALLKLANTGDARKLGFLIRRDQIRVDGKAVDGQELLFGESMDASTLYKLPVNL